MFFTLFSSNICNYKHSKQHPILACSNLQTCCGDSRSTASLAHCRQHRAYLLATATIPAGCMFKPRIVVHPFASFQIFHNKMSRPSSDIITQALRMCPHNLSRRFVDYKFLKIPEYQVKSTHSVH